MAAPEGADASRVLLSLNGTHARNALNSETSPTETPALVPAVAFYPVEEDGIDTDGLIRDDVEGDGMDVMDETAHISNIDMPQQQQQQQHSLPQHRMSPLRPPRIFKRRRRQQQQQQQRGRRHRYHVTNNALADEYGYHNKNNNNNDKEDNDEEDHYNDHRDEFDDDLTFTDNWSLDDDSSLSNNNHHHFIHPFKNHPHHIVDLDVCQQLDLEYDQALEDRQVVWTARYQSVRQSTVVSIFAMVFLIASGTAFYYKQAEPYWTIPEALLFTIYTITTVGYVAIVDFGWIRICAPGIFSHCSLTATAIWKCRTRPFFTGTRSSLSFSALPCSPYSSRKCTSASRWRRVG
jgi:hypothetical protein